MTDLRRLYFKLRERVFLEKHMDLRSTELEAFIQEVLGTALKMNDVQQPKWGEQAGATFISTISTSVPYILSSFSSHVDLLSCYLCLPIAVTYSLRLHIRHIIYVVYFIPPRLLIGTANKQTTRLELRLFNNCLEDEYSEGKCMPWSLPSCPSISSSYHLDSDLRLKLQGIIMA